jgi:hypothetical protein
LVAHENGIGAENKRSKLRMLPIFDTQVANWTFVGRG